MKTLTPLLACCALILLTLSACGPTPEQIAAATAAAASPTVAASPTATMTPLPLPTRPAATPTASPTAKPRPTQTRPPTRTPTQTPTFTPKPLATGAQPTPGDFKFQGLSGKVRAAQAPTCAAAGARFGLKVEDAATATAASCVVLLVYVPNLSDARQIRSVYADLYPSSLVDPGGARSRRQAAGQVPDPNGTTLMMWLSFYVSPDSQSFTWKLPDGREVAISPAR